MLVSVLEFEAVNDLLIQRLHLGRCVRWQEHNQYVRKLNAVEAFLLKHVESSVFWGIAHQHQDVAVANTGEAVSALPLLLEHCNCHPVCFVGVSMAHLQPQSFLNIWVGPEHTGLSGRRAQHYMFYIYMGCCL